MPNWWPGAVASCASAPGRALLLGEVVDRAGPPARPAPEGLGAHTVRPRRRRPGRGGPDAARVPHRRGDARARHPDHAGALRRRHRRAGAARAAPARRGALPGGGEPPAGGHVPVRRRHRRPRRAARPRRLRHRPPLPRRRRRGEPYLELYRRRHRRAGRARGALDARRVRARRDEHRQHVDLRRDHRLRPVRVPRRLRSRPRSSAPSTSGGRYAYGNQPPSPTGTSRASARRCCRSSTRTPTPRWPPPSTRSTGSPRAFQGHWDAGMAAKLGLARARPEAGRGPGRPAAHPARRLHVVLPRAVRAGTARDLFLDRDRVRRVGRAAATRCCPPTGRRWRRPWTGSTRSTSRATTAWRRRSPRPPRATSGPFRTLLDVVARPFTERPGLEDYAGPGRKAASRTSPTAAPDRRAASAA